MDENKNITDAMLPIIRKKIQLPDSAFQLWFADLKLLDLSEDSARFSTSTAMRQKILSTRYIDVIRSALAEVIGFDVDVNITYDSNMDFPEYRPEEKFVEDPEQKKEDERKVADIINSKPGKTSSTLDEYTFENFIVGESNKFAYAACLAVAKEPTTYNPLFIYGHSGLGKTHLLYAVIHYLRENHPNLKIVYKKSEDFMNELIASLSDSSTHKFKDKYRSADVLLIDDIQFIAGKESTQEEFFHTFSTLYEADKQIILTSDRPPKEIKPLEDRLRTRFEGGLIADVQPPSLELRTAIIRKKCEDMNIRITPDLIDYMADRLQNNIRQIQGVLKRLDAVKSLGEEEVTKAKIDEIISVIDPGNVPTSVTVDRILSVVAKKYGITVDDLLSKKKSDNIANPRHVAIYIIRKETALSLKEIGRIFSRDHTTVMASLGKVEMQIATVKNMEADINDMIKKSRG